MRFDRVGSQLYHRIILNPSNSARFLPIIIVQIIFMIVFAALTLVGGCEPSPGADAAGSAADAAKSITVASLVPSATDVISAIGGGEQLLAVGNYDHETLAAGRPRIGDYQNVDWERLAKLRPDLLVIFHDPARVSEGWKQRAADLNIRFINFRSETLQNIYDQTLDIGAAIGRPQQASEFVRGLKQRLSQLAEKSAGHPPIRTLLLMDGEGTAAVGRDNFLNDLLVLAGGENVISTSGWPTLDRERLIALSPDVIILLLSGVAPHVKARALDQVTAMGQLPAVRNGRVGVINQWYAIQSGAHVGEVAEQMFEILHRPAFTTQPPPTEAGRE